MLLEYTIHDKQYTMSKLDLATNILAPCRLNLFPSQCLRERHQEQVCDICIKNCPYEAIEVRKGIVVDETKCQGCGICTHLCPAGVFELKNWPELIKQNTLAIKDSQVKIGCNQVKGKVDGEIPCIGLISEGFLLYLIKKGAEVIYLDDSACVECPANWAIKTIAQIKISIALKILEEFGHKGRISFQTESRANSNKGGYSRRDFFLHLRDSTLKRMAFFTQTPENKEPKHRVPNARLLLLGALQKLGRIKEEKISQNGLPFYQIEISQSCNACEFCSRLCPTGALSKLTTDVSEKIRFKLGYCTGCGLCQMICPKQAINMTKEVEITWLLSGQEQELVNYAYAKCPDCERRYLETEEECLFCRKEAVADTFFDELFKY